MNESSEEDFSPRQWKAIELLAKGDMGYHEVSRQVGVTYRTLQRWRRQTAFATMVRDRALETLKEAIPQVYNVLVTKSVDEADLNAIKLLLERLDRAEMDVAHLAEGQVTFTWKDREDND